MAREEGMSGRSWYCTTEGTPMKLLWLVLMVLFLVLGLWHLNQFSVAMPPFKVTQRPQGITVEIVGMNIDKPLTDFATDFNAYLAVQNEASRKANLAAAFGYFLAALAAALPIVLQGREPHREGRSYRGPVAGRVRDCRAMPNLLESRPTSCQWQGFSRLKMD